MNEIKLTRKYSDYNNNHSDSEENLLEALKEKRKFYKETAHLHKLHEKTFQNIYMILSYPALLFSILVTTLTGSKSLNSSDDNHLMLATFILSFFSSILIASVTFFKIQQRSNKHSFASVTYSDFYKKIDVFLLRNHDKEDYSDQLNIYLNSELLLDEISPNYSCLVKL